MGRRLPAFQKRDPRPVPELHRRPVPQRAVRPLRIVPPPPSFRLRPRVQCTVEQLLVQTLPPQRGVEALPVRVLPRAPRRDVMRPHALLRQPLHELAGDELRPVVAPQVLRWIPFREQSGQRRLHLPRGHRPAHLHCQTLPGVLVLHGEHPQRSSPDGPVVDEVVVMWIST